MPRFPSFLTSPDLLSPAEEALYRLDHLAFDGTLLAFSAGMFGITYGLLIFPDRAFLGHSRAFFLLLTLRLVFIGMCLVMMLSLRRVRSASAQEAWALAFSLALFITNIAVLNSRPRTYSQNVTIEVIALLTLYATLPDRPVLRVLVPMALSLPGLFFALFLKVHVGVTALVSIVVAYLWVHLVGCTAIYWLGLSRRQSWKRERELQELVRERTDLANLRESFITTVSHEFRTPLHAIQTSNDLLERHRERLEPERFHELFSRIRSSVLTLTAMIDDVLTVHRLDARMGSAGDKDLQLDAWLQELVAPLVATPESPGVELELAPGLGLICLDEELLRQVLGNLLDNARKYTPADGRVLLRARRAGADLLLDLEDTGIGIPRAEQDRVFTRFLRGSNSHGVRGTGLGLSIVREALALLGGNLELNSEEGRGTRIHVRLSVQTGAPHVA